MIRPIIIVSILAALCIVGLAVLSSCPENYATLRRVGLLKGHAMAGPDASLIDDRYGDHKYSAGHRYRTRQRHQSYREHKHNT